MTHKMTKKSENDGKKEKKIYEKPVITKRNIRIKELVMAPCKDTSSVTTSAPGGSKCKNMGSACIDDVLS